MSKFRNNKTNKNQGIHTIFGQHSVKAALQNDKREHIELIVSRNHINFPKKYVAKIQKITILPQNEFTRRFGNENTTQGVVLKTKDFTRPGLEEFVKVESKKAKSVILILDQVTDPQNVGSIIRSAFAFNFDAVCLLKNNSPIETPSLIKASAGEIDKIQILEIGNLVQEIKILKKQNFFIYGLDGEGKIKIQEIDKADNRIALIIGAEGKGLRNLTKKNVDKLVKIDINPKCNSLNAANATTVAMYEISKN